MNHAQTFEEHLAKLEADYSDVSVRRAVLYDVVKQMGRLMANQADKLQDELTQQQGQVGEIMQVSKDAIGQLQTFADMRIKQEREHKDRAPVEVIYKKGKIHSVNGKPVNRIAIDERANG